MFPALCPEFLVQPAKLSGQSTVLDTPGIKRLVEFVDKSVNAVLDVRVSEPVSVLCLFALSAERLFDGLDNLISG